MLTYTGGLKLIDFGLAQWNDKVAQTAAGTNWGKSATCRPSSTWASPSITAAISFPRALSCGSCLPDGSSSRPPIAPARPENPGTLHPQRRTVHQIGRGGGKALAWNPAERFATGEEMSAALFAEMPRDGGGKLAAATFIAQLFDAEMRAETAEQRELLQRTAALGAQVPPLEASDSASNETDPLVGTVLGDRYHVRRRIGEGAMGRVYEGHHTGIGKRVAIKIPRRAERRKSELARRFQREALAPSQIGHPNVVDVTDWRDD